MSSKCLSMDDLKRLTQSQTKSKMTNKLPPNLTTTEPPVSSYTKITFIKHINILILI